MGKTATNTRPHVAILSLEDLQTVFPTYKVLMEFSDKMSTKIDESHKEIMGAIQENRDVVSKQQTDMLGKLNSLEQKFSTLGKGWTFTVSWMTLAKIIIPAMASLAMLLYYAKAILRV